MNLNTLYPLRARTVSYGDSAPVVRIVTSDDYSMPSGGGASLSGQVARRWGQRDNDLVCLDEYLRTSDGGFPLYSIVKATKMPKRFRNRWIRTHLSHNPRKYGAKGYMSFRIILDADNSEIFAAEYFARGGRTQDLDWDFSHERVSYHDCPRAEDTFAAPEPAPAAEPAYYSGMTAPAIGTNDAAEFELDGEVLPACFKRIMDLASIGENLLLVGPSGSGKTYLAAKLAEKLGRPFAAQNCSAGMAEYHLAGRLLPIGDSGKFSYIPSPFIDMYENGGVFLFDEADAADENTFIFINSALANGSFFISERFDNPEVTRHPDFIAIATANTFGLGESDMYSGRNRLDDATLDRFRSGVVEVDYSERVELTLVDPEVYRWGIRIRVAIAAHGWQRIMSTRVMVRFSLQKEKLNYGRSEWERTYFADWTEDERAVLAQAPAG